MHPRDVPPTPAFSGALERLLRDRVDAAAAAAPRASRRRRMAVAAVAAATVLAAIAGPPALDSEPANATGFRFAGGTTIALDSLDDRADYARLRRAFARAGVPLVVRSRAVAPRDAGRVYSVSAPDGARFDDEGRLIVAGPSRAPVVLVVGRSGAATLNARDLTVYEAIPRLCELVQPHDAPATARALRRAGYRLRLIEVRWRGASRRVAEPPPGTIVFSVLGPSGRYEDVDPRTNTLMLEVGMPGDGHRGQTDAACPPASPR